MPVPAWLAVKRPGAVRVTRMMVDAVPPFGLVTVKVARPKAVLDGISMLI